MENKREIDCQGQYLKAMNAKPPSLHTNSASKLFQMKSENNNRKGIAKTE